MLSAADRVRIVGPGQIYEGRQGFTYGAGASWIVIHASGSDQEEIVGVWASFAGDGLVRVLQALSGWSENALEGSLKHAPRRQGHITPLPSIPTPRPTSARRRDMLLDAAAISRP